MSDLFSESDFKVFRSVVENGGIVKSINVKGGAAMSRSQIDGLIAFAQEQGAGGMAWIKATVNGLESSIVNFLDDECRTALTERMGAEPGDLLIFVADRKTVVNRTLGAVRLKLGEDLGLIDHASFDILFVTEFPLFEMDEENNKLTFMHHMFTAPVEEDLQYLESDPLRIRSRAYDLVVNGTEIVSGSIRIHDHEMQMRMFNRLGISEEDARGKFGFLMNAFDYGPPPHGGAAFGFDRFIMLLRGASSIREVIAFPKTNQGVSLMDEAPSEVDAEQLIALGIKIRKN